MTHEIGVDEVLEQIRFLVQKRRSEGLYPPGLEQQLEQEFAQIISSTNRRYLASVALAEQIERSAVSLNNVSGYAITKSRVPGGSIIHKVFSFISRRQVLGLAAQVKDAQEHMLACLRLLADFAQAQENADQRLVKELSQHVLDRISVVDHLAILATELEMRINQLEARLDNR